MNGDGFGIGDGKWLFSVTESKIKDRGEGGRGEKVKSEG